MSQLLATQRVRWWRITFRMTFFFLEENHWEIHWNDGHLGCPIDRLGLWNIFGLDLDFFSLPCTCGRVITKKGLLVGLSLFQLWFHVQYISVQMCLFLFQIVKPAKNFFGRRANIWEIAVAHKIRILVQFERFHLQKPWFASIFTSGSFQRDTFPFKCQNICFTSWDIIDNLELSPAGSKNSSPNKWNVGKSIIADPFIFLTQ